MTRRLGSLASRLVVVGVVQLVLLAVTAVVIFIAEGPHDAARPEDHIVPSLIQHLENVADDQPSLETALGKLRSQRIEASVYDANRLLVASNVDPPLAIPERRGRRPLSANSDSATSAGSGSAAPQHPDGVGPIGDGPAAGSHTRGPYSGSDSGGSNADGFNTRGDGRAGPDRSRRDARLVLDDGPQPH
nr:hypothetical protein [Deltaproteobacteria bacterium]